MVALTLMVLIFTIMPIGSSNQFHTSLEESMEEFDRATRFAVNEAILRNSIVRISIDMDKEPNEFAVEYGPSGNMVLPGTVDTDKLSIKDRERELKKVKSIDGQFSRVAEFSEENKLLPDTVNITGIYSAYLQKTITEGKVSIYFYPTGEKDNSLIFLTTEEEMGTFDIPPFENRTIVNYHLYSEYELNRLDDAIEEKMKDLLDKWLKE